VGCGNSQLSDEMYKDGIKNITCIDLSPVAVDKVQKRLSSKGYKGMCFYMLLTCFVQVSLDITD